MPKKIIIIGSRGIPASYGGFETSVEETSIRFVKRGYEVEVHCRRHHYRERPKELKGVRLKYVPSVENKFLDTITHTALSTVLMFFSRVDYIILYGVGNSCLIPFLRLRGVPVIAVVDGADWERAKWNGFARWFLRMNRYFAVHFASHYVVDNEFLAEAYRTRFAKPPVYIPYGANEVYPYDDRVIHKFGLKEREYIIFVGRFVKEKGIDILIRAFEQITTNKKLIIVGDNDIDRKYADYIRSTTDSRIVFTGFLYGGEYESLLQKALFYVSASLLEGTSPALLSAMAINGFALVSDLRENQEVLKGSCQTFRTGDVIELRDKLAYYISNPEVIDIQREKTKEIVNKYYNWDEITNRYQSLLS